MKSTYWVKKDNFLAKKKIVIVFHEATTGLAYDLRDYLLKKEIEELLFISHPLLYLKENFKKSSWYEYYKDGKIVKKGNAFHWVLPEYFLYIKDILYTLLWCFSIGRSFDIYIGIGNLNAFTGCILRFLKRVEKVVYYVIDYVPERFQNKLVNDVYHWIERFVAFYSNRTWNLSPRMIKGREKRWKTFFPNQLVVPHGVAFSRIKRVLFEKINKTEILYMGVLLKNKGVQLIIEALPKIIKHIPNVKVSIIGKGPYEEELRNLVQKLHLESYIEFLGYISNHEEVENRIAKAAIAIALYDKADDEFTYYADPGKIKTYIGAGVPVIMTDVPYVAREVVKANCGFIVPYKQDALTDVILTFLQDEKLMRVYRKNAIKFAKKYDWDRVFADAFSSI